MCKTSKHDRCFQGEIGKRDEDEVLLWSIRWQLLADWNDVSFNSDGEKSNGRDGEILHVNQNINTLNDKILLSHSSDIEEGVESDNEINNNDNLDETNVRYPC